jgi:hypothetical protein
MKNILFVFFIIWFAFLVGSCKKDEIKLEAPQIELVSGADQNGLVGSDLGNPIEIIVRDQNGNPFQGTIVNFAVIEGSVSSETESTDANGKASTIWTLGQTSGTQTLTITALKVDGKTALKGSPINVSSTANQKIPTEGLIAYYPFNGNANDESGNNHDGKINGATIAIDRFGNSNSCYSFDGNDWIDIPDDPAFSFGSDPFTISIWTKIDSYGVDGGYYLFAHSNGPGNTTKWIFWFGSTSLIFINDGWSLIGSYNFELSTWYHLVLVRTGANISGYVNDMIIGTGSVYSTLGDPSANLTLGTAEFDRPNRYLRGNIDDIRIYNRILTNEEIFALYHENDWIK